MFYVLRQPSLYKTTQRLTGFHKWLVLTPLWTEVIAWVVVVTLPSIPTEVFGWAPPLAHIAQCRQRRLMRSAGNHCSQKKSAVLGCHYLSARQVYMRLFNMFSNVNWNLITMAILAFLVLSTYGSRWSLPNKCSTFHFFLKTLKKVKM